MNGGRVVSETRDPRKAAWTVRDVTISETQILAVGRAAARTRDPELKAVLLAIVEFWHANEATEQMLPS